MPPTRKLSNVVRIPSRAVYLLVNSYIDNNHYYYTSQVGKRARSFGSLEITVKSPSYKNVKLPLDGVVPNGP